ncbi:hypothetical protein YPPY04_2491 [Yersinia pestis PY-04]|nr:hypothetical protein YPPY04_2491 [Yersinia pestis PY-04]
MPYFTHKKSPQSVGIGVFIDQLNGDYRLIFYCVRSAHPSRAWLGGYLSEEWLIYSGIRK